MFLYKYRAHENQTNWTNLRRNNMSKVSNSPPAYEYQKTNSADRKKEDYNLLFPQISKQMPRGIGKLPNIDLSQTNFLFDEKDNSYLC